MKNEEFASAFYIAQQASPGEGIMEPMALQSIFPQSVNVTSL